MSHRHWKVLWTRGEGCEALADRLSAGGAVVVEGDLRTACIAAQADLLVQRKLTSFDLVDAVVPHGFDPEVRSVVAAVGGGPHSLLAAQVAERLAGVAGVEGSIVSASRHSDDDPTVESILDHIAAGVPTLPTRMIRAGSARELVATLDEGTLLVLGAPGGSWIQRQFFGPGRQLMHGAPGGVVVVRSAPRRCFQEAQAAAALSPLLSVTDARLLMEASVVPVAEDGRLVGLLRREAVETPGGGSIVRDVMEEPVFLAADDPVDAASELGTFLAGSPVPVVDKDGRLLGTLRAPGG